MDADHRRHREQHQRDRERDAKPAPAGEFAQFGIVGGPFARDRHEHHTAFGQLPGFGLRTSVCMGQAYSAVRAMASGIGISVVPHFGQLLGLHARCPGASGRCNGCRPLPVVQLPPSTRRADDRDHADDANAQRLPSGRSPARTDAGIRAFKLDQDTHGTGTVAGWRMQLGSRRAPRHSIPCPRLFPNSRLDARADPLQQDPNLLAQRAHLRLADQLQHGLRIHERNRHRSIDLFTHDHVAR